jgi:hypothetical protein
MSTPASAVLNRVVDVLHDTGNIRWTEPELLRWLSDGQREIAIHHPDASVSNVAIQLTAGATKQTLPATAVRLVGILRNAGAAGVTPGRAIRIVDKNLLDASRPSWHSDQAETEVKNYTYDARDPRTFYVYPAPLTGFYVEAVLAVPPTELTATSDLLSVDDLYANPLVDYTLYRCFTKDAEYTGNKERAIAHYQAFAASIGLRVSTDTTESPNTNSTFVAGNPAPGKAAGGAL